MMGLSCVMFSGKAKQAVIDAKAAAKECFESPPPPINDCEHATGPNVEKCKQINDCTVFKDAVVVHKSTLDSMPKQPPELDHLDSIVDSDPPAPSTDTTTDAEDTPTPNLIQMRSDTKIALVDDIIVVATTCAALYGFINSLIAWFKPAELSPSQQKTLNSWLDYANVVIDISKTKLKQYAAAIDKNPVAANLAEPITLDLRRFEGTLAKLKKEVQDILGLMQQCKDERDREFSAGLTWGAVFSFGISYAAWWDLKNKRIRSWHDEVMCGVDQLNPRISAVRATMDALHADISLRILALFQAKVDAPVWADG